MAEQTSSDKNFKKTVDEFAKANEQHERNLKRQQRNTDTLSKVGYSVLDTTREIGNIVKNDIGTFVEDITTLGNDIANSIPGVRSVVNIGKFLGKKTIGSMVENRKEKKLRESLGYDKDEFRRLKREQELKEENYKNSIDQLN